MAAVHALSALAVVLVLYYLIRGIFATGVEQANHWIQLVTFAVITAIGAVILYGADRRDHREGDELDPVIGCSTPVAKMRGSVSRGKDHGDR